MVSPEFNHRITGGLHKLGDLMCTPFTFYLGHAVKVFDPIVKGRSEAMGQASTPAREIARRVVIAPFLLIALVPSAIIAGAGQLIKIPCNLDKKTFSHVKPPNLSPTVFETKEEHKIISWNLGAMPSVMRYFNHTRPVENRMRDAVEYIKKENPEFVAFQESFTDEATNILYNGLKEKLPHVVHHVGKNVIGLNSGLAIMSAYPIVGEPVFEDFEGRTGTNALSQKGCLGVILDLGDNKRAVVVNTHLEAGGKGRTPVAKETLPDDVRSRDLTKEEKKYLTSAKFSKANQITHAEKMKQALIEKAKKGGGDGEIEIVFSCIMGDTNVQHDLRELEQPIFAKAKAQFKAVYERSVKPEQEPVGASVFAKSKRILDKNDLENEAVQIATRNGEAMSRIDITEIDNNNSHISNLLQKVDRSVKDASDHWPLVSTFKYAKPDGQS